MDGETIGWTDGWPDGRVNGAGSRGWVSGRVDGWGDNWMDGRVAQRRGEWGRKVGWVSGPDRWMGRPLDGREGDPTDGKQCNSYSQC